MFGVRLSGFITTLIAVFAAVVTLWAAFATVMWFRASMEAIRWESAFRIACRRALERPRPSPPAAPTEQIFKGEATRPRSKRPRSA